VRKIRAVAAFCIFSLFTAAGFAFADDAEAKPEGFHAEIGISADALRYKINKFDKVENRRDDVADKSYVEYYPFGDFNFDGVNIRVGYDASWFGGSFSLNKADSIHDIKAWVSFFDGKFKLTAGNAIGTGYGDTQGGSALRVYTGHDNYDDDYNPIWEGSKNPGNITTVFTREKRSDGTIDFTTEDKGVLAELFLQKLSFALATMGDNKSNTTTYNGKVNVGHYLQFAGHAGYDFGLGNVNLQYIFNSEKLAGNYKNLDGTIVPTDADAKVTGHLFGASVSVYPVPNVLGITLGYAGEYISYLDAFYPASSKVAPTQQGVLKNGINLNVKYTANNRLTFHTDHNYSFFTDKDYTVYTIEGGSSSAEMINYTLQPENSGAVMADVAHRFIWNALGADYALSDTIGLSVNLHNLLRIDAADSKTMGAIKLVRDKAALESKVNFTIKEHVSFSVGFIYELETISASKELAEEMTVLQGGASPDAVLDINHTIRVPVTFTVRF
jgi:hypothetical protein